MTSTHRLLFALLCLVWPLLSGARTPAVQQTDLAGDLLAVLTDAQRDEALHAWASDDRTEWTYFPWGHSGLPLSDMAGPQRDKALALLTAALSENGYRKAREVMALEAAEAEKGFISRLWTDGLAYYTAVFGAPAPDDPWSWRFEGHHLSVNMTSAGGEVVSGTPYFIGADPAIVAEGRLAGMRILAREEIDARALFLSLNATQRERALIRKKAPRDILTGSDSHVELACCEGIAFTALDESQRGELLALVDLIAGQLHPGVAALHLDRMHEAGLERLHFAWAGSAEPGIPHYYRIQGPTLLIEYANTQNDANHIHLVRRDPKLDFGRDPLREHLRAAH